MVPCVSTNWGEAASEILIRDGLGYMANTFNEFVEMVTVFTTSLEKRNRAAQRAFNAFQTHFTSDIHTERYIELIEEVFGFRSESVSDG